MNCIASLSLCGNSTPEVSDLVVVKKIQEAFPGALTNAQLVHGVKTALEKHGYSSTTTLLATSLCCDEVNRVLEDDFRRCYGCNNFSMGGLAGFPFGGITSFGVMAHHIPADGSCLIVYGPHVGVDSEGVIGKVNRRGRPGSSGACCGSATAAAAYVKSAMAKETEKKSIPTDPLDAQQTFVGAALLPHGERLQKAADPGVELPLALLDCQNKMMNTIVSSACGEVAGKGLICLLGGIQINTPEGVPDHFLVKVFELRNNKGEVVQPIVL